MKQISTWLWHRIYLSNNGESVFKVPNFPKYQQKMQDEIDYVKTQFWKFIPETKLRKHWYSYILRQEYIDSLTHFNWQNWEFANHQLQELLELNKKSIETNGKSLELVGSEWTIKCLFSSLRRYKWTWQEKSIILPLLHSLSLFPTTKNLLDWWNMWAYPELSNIMITQDGKLKVIDIWISNHTSKNPIASLRGYAIEKWNEYFIKRYFDIIKKD